MAEDKRVRLKGMSYLCQLPENGWDSQKIYDRLDASMGLGDLKGKIQINFFNSGFAKIMTNLTSCILTNQKLIFRY